MQGTWKIFWKVGAFASCLVLLIAAMVGAWVYLQLQPRELAAARERWPSGMTLEEIDQTVLDLVSQMTLDEKLDQMQGSGIVRMVLSLVLRRTAAPVYSGENERLGIPPLAFTDGSRGVISGHSTSFPVSIARAASWDVELERRVGDVIGKEVRVQGANYWAGLCINLVRHPSMGRAEETYGEDPWLTGEMAVAALEGVQQHNVMACAKHFALNNQETARFKNDVQIDERTLREVYLPHFRKVVEHGVASIMSAYNKVRGEWCGENRYLLTTVLRQEWGFRGFVSSDWFWGVWDGARGVHAGLDVEMPRARFYGDNLKQLIENGEVPEAEIDESVRRIVRAKLEFLLRDDPTDYPPELAAAPEHIELAREVAEKSMVLLQNENDLLPLDRADLDTIAVIGRLADDENTGDRGSSNVTPPHRTSALQGVRDYLAGSATVLHADGSDLDEVGRLAGEADVVLVVAGTHHEEVGEYISDEEGLRPNGPAEKKPIIIEVPFLEEPIILAGGDRVPLALQERDRSTIATACRANPSCVVALVGGSVFTIEEWKDDARAILMAWYFGMEGGNALARILFGEVNPSGKMPLTTPRDDSQLPPFDEFADTTEVGPYHGYTLIDRQGGEPTFPFGHGLSYTTYEYDRLIIATPEIGPGESLDATVEVTNTGDRAGEEVVQLYIGFAGSQVERPVKLLRDFAKVFLEPGETRSVSLSVAAEDLAWFDPESMAWKIEPMRYGVFVGPSSRDEDLLSASFTVSAAAVLGPARSPGPRH